VSGGLRFSRDDDGVDLNPGDTVYPAPGRPCHVANDGDEPTLFVSSIIPAQELSLCA
jgi:mannose-6-phosphate isomerase-like protein (cupin superfamily)